MLLTDTRPSGATHVVLWLNPACLSGCVAWGQGALYTHLAVLLLRTFPTLGEGREPRTPARTTCSHPCKNGYKALSNKIVSWCCACMRTGRCGVRQRRQVPGPTSWVPLMKQQRGYCRTLGCGWVSPCLNTCLNNSQVTVVWGVSTIAVSDCAVFHHYCHTNMDGTRPAQAMGSFAVMAVEGCHCASCTAVQQNIAKCCMLPSSTRAA